jgi:IS1 family transposase
MNYKIKGLVKEGMGISNMSRYLNISTTTVMKRIKQIASKIKTPSIFPTQDTYEVDEMYSYLGSKGSQCWLMYAISREQKQVVHFEVGGRTKNNARKVIDNLLLRQARKIYTDKLAMYRSLVPRLIHSTRHRQTNHIERHNLNIRINCKRFARRSICYSKSIIMLEAVLKIFFCSRRVSE